MDERKAQGSDIRPKGSELSDGDACLHESRPPRGQVGASPSFLPRWVERLCRASLRPQRLARVVTYVILSFTQQVSVEHPPCAGTESPRE